MRLETIKSSGFKGQELDTKLTGRDMFVGPNGSGKSAHVEAVQLAVLGHIPSVGKALDAHRDLFSQETATVGAVFAQDAGSIFREFTVSPDTGSVRTADVTVTPGLEYLTEIPPTVFNVASFLGMSNADKRKYIFGLLPPDPNRWNRQRVENELLAVGVDNLKEDTPEHIAESIRALVVDLLVDWNVKLDAAVAFPLLEKKAKQWLKERKVLLKNATATIQRLSGIVSELRGDIDPAQLKSELETAEGNLQTARDQYATGLAAQQERARWDKVVSTEFDPKSINGYDDYEKMKAVECPEDIGAWRQDELKKAEELLGTVADQEKAWTSLMGDLTTRQGNLTWLLEILEQADKSSDTCPLCDHDGFSAGKRGEGLVATLAEVDRLIEGQNITKRRIEEVEKEANDTIHEINTERGVFVANLDEIAGFEKRMAKIVEDEKEKRLELERKMADVVVPDIDKLTDLIASTELKVEALRGSVERLQRSQGLAEELQTARTDKIVFEYAVAALKDLVKRLGPAGLMGDMVREQLVPLQSAINGILRPAWNRHLYVASNKPNGAEDFNLRVLDDITLTSEFSHTGIGFSALSHGQRALVAIAVLVAIVSIQKLSWRPLIIDHIEALDSENRAAMFKVLAGLEGFDNIIVCGHTDVTERPEGFNVHELGK